MGEAQSEATWRGGLSKACCNRKLFLCLNKEAVLFNFLIIRFVGKEFRYQRGRDGAEEQFRSWARQGDQSV